MAAAGIGNMVSDLSGMTEWSMGIRPTHIIVIGLGLADRVDALCRRFGIPDPKLTSGQLTLTSSRWMSLLVCIPFSHTLILPFSHVPFHYRVDVLVSS